MLIHAQTDRFYSSVARIQGERFSTSFTMKWKNPSLNW